tara:strand:+ start:267 stop:1637 length:1371 start_codon:yes stop_codon:yes gene_type:complete
MAVEITRTPSSNGNQKIWTWSGWIKKATVGMGSGDYQMLFTANIGSGSRYTDVFFREDYFEVFGGVYSTSTTTVDINVSTNRKFRDPSAFYHLVVAVDTTQATASNRVKIYVNGVQETSLKNYQGSSVVYPAQNNNTFMNVTTAQNRIGASGGSYPFKGLMTHVHFIDGTAYTPSTFGETDSTSGIWKPKASPTGITYGTNGFFLKFENSGNLDLDSSGNNHTFATSGTLTQNVDTPSNNFATFSTIYQPKDSGNAGMSNGNLTHGGSGGDYSGCAGLGMKTGKYYWEVKFSAGSSTRNIGIVRADKIHSNTTYGFYLAQGGSGSLTTEYSAGYRGADGDFVVKSTGSQTLTSASTTIAIGDIVGVAVDCDNYTIQFFKNGVSMQTLNLTSAFFDVAQLPADRTDDGTYFQYNFGQGYFGTTAVASAGTAPSEGGIFEYNCPNGYQALCTKGINSF